MDFNLNNFMEKFANEIGGQFTEYDASRAVIVVPVDEHRYQSVLGTLKTSSKFIKDGIEFTSKVCNDADVSDHKMLLDANSTLCYSKFVLVDGYLKVEASAFLEHANEALLRAMLLETAKVADEWEYKITGKDVF
ncbi:MAG: hypothetical protein HC842_09345 [Cytophagales bacterium]|nr:hypothetical protein [Cytophagales bacterium]